MKKSIIALFLIVVITFTSIFMVFANKDKKLYDDVDNQEITTDIENELENAGEVLESEELDDSSMYQEKLLKYDSKNGIDMAITFDNQLEENEKYIVFKVMINNHSIDLGKIKYDKIVKLQTSDENIIDDGFIWESDSDGHHIFGYLMLPKLYNGDKVINENIDYLELVFEGVGSADRLAFRWDKEKIDLYIRSEKNEI